MPGTGFCWVKKLMGAANYQNLPGCGFLSLCEVPSAFGTDQMAEVVPAVPLSLTGDNKNMRYCSWKVADSSPRPFPCSKQDQIPLSHRWCLLTFSAVCSDEDPIASLSILYQLRIPHNAISFAAKRVEYCLPPCWPGRPMDNLLLYNSISYVKSYCAHYSFPWHIHPSISCNPYPVCNSSETSEAPNVFFFFSSFFPPLNPPFPSLLVCNSWWAFALSLCENRQALRCGKHRYSDLAWLLCKGSSLIFNSPGSWAIIHPKAAWLTFSEVFWCLTVVPLIKSFVQKAKLKGVPEDTRISCFPSASQLFIKGSRGLEWNI